MNQQIIKNNRMLQIKTCQMISKNSVAPFSMDILRKYRLVSKGMHFPTLVFASLLKEAVFRKYVQVNKKEMISNIFKLYLTVIPAKFREDLFAVRDLSASEILKTIEKIFYLKDQSSNEKDSLHEKFSAYSRNSTNNYSVQQTLNAINALIFHRPSLLQMDMKAAQIITISNFDLQEKRRVFKSLFLKGNNLLNFKTLAPLKSQQHDYSNLHIGHVHNHIRTLQVNQNIENGKLISAPAMWKHHRHVESLLLAERFTSKGHKIFQDRTGAHLIHLKPEMKTSLFGKSYSTNLHSDGRTTITVQQPPKKGIFTTDPVTKNIQYYNNKNKSTKIHKLLLMKGVRIPFMNMTDVAGIRGYETFSPSVITQRENKIAVIYRNNLNGKERVEPQMMRQRADYPGLFLPQAKSLTMKGRKVKSKKSSGGTSLVYSKESFQGRKSTDYAETNESIHGVGNIAKSMSVENQENLVTELFQKIPARQVSILADKVYNLIEKKIFIEQDRRGFI